MAKSPKAKLTIDTTVAPPAATPKPASKRKDIHEVIASFDGSDSEDGESENEDGGLGKIEMILRLHKRGYSNKEIIAAGFNKSTVYRQTGEFKKLSTGPVKSYYGLEAFEGRVIRTMRTRKCTREEAIDWIVAKDEEAAAKEAGE